MGFIEDMQLSCVTTDQAVTEEPKCVDREIDGHNTVVSWRLLGGGQCSDTRPPR